MVKKITDIKSKSTKKPNHIWRLKTQRKKSFFIIIVLLLFFILNGLVVFSEGRTFITDITSFSKQGIKSLLNAKENAKLANFEQAESAFLDAEKIFNNLNKNSWFLTQDLKTPEALLNSASLLAESGKDLSQLAINFKDLPDQFLKYNESFLSSGKTETPQNITAPITEALPTLAKIQENLNLVSGNLDTVNTALLPTEIKKDFLTAKDEINSLQEILNNFSTYLEVVLDLLGSQVPHTYLVLIQNNFEQRPTGGFVGSLLFAEVNNGILTDFNLKDVYDFDGLLIDNPKYLPPEYIGFNSKLWIRDANYTPDFMISSKRIETMLQRAKAPSVDTIISIDQTFIEDVLGLTGPVPLENFDGKITADNYFTVLTYLVEANKFDNQNDKEILQSFIANFEKQIFSIKDFKGLFEIINQNLHQKHIQVFSKKDFIQNQIQHLGFSNLFQPTQDKNQDLLLVTNTSIGGNKTDKYIKQRYIHNTHFNRDNTIQDTLTIRKYHSFVNREEFVWQNYLRPFGVTELVDFTRYILGRGDNVSMVKVYVPNDSELDSIKGLPKNTKVSKFTDPDLNQDYFLFRMAVKPGETKEVSLTYTPKIKIKPNPAAQYNLSLQSQAGSFNTVFQKTYSFADPTTQKIYLHNPAITSYSKDGIPTSEFPFESNVDLKAVYAQY